MNTPFRSFFPILAVVMVASAASLGAQERTFRIDPARTTVEFTLGATLHTVHGALRLSSGRVGFDPVTGRASGELVVDSISARTGNAERDAKMHREILESARFPRIVFRPDRVEGKVAGQGVSKVELHGSFEIHGVRHEVAVPVEVRASAEEYAVTASFGVPYVKWGMKNPSTFILRVSDHVDVAVHAVATSKSGE
jgi:polyisoprenoid-binding protein YceI